VLFVALVLSACGGSAASSVAGAPAVSSSQSSTVTATVSSAVSLPDHLDDTKVKAAIAAGSIRDSEKDLGPCTHLISERSSESQCYACPVLSDDEMHAIATAWRGWSDVHMTGVDGVNGVLCEAALPQELVNDPLGGQLLVAVAGRGGATALAASSPYGEPLESATIGDWYIAVWERSGDQPAVGPVDADQVIAAVAAYLS
jgi:hypothetical protein